MNNIAKSCLKNCFADEVLWFEHCENTPSSAEQSTQHFGELANALQILHHYKKEWNEDDVISIIDEITSNLNLFLFISSLAFKTPS